MKDDNNSKNDLITLYRTNYFYGPTLDENFVCWIFFFGILRGRKFECIFR